MTAILVVTDTTGLMFTSPISFSSSSSSSNVNYLVGIPTYSNVPFWGDHYVAPGTCEEDGCGKDGFLPTEDCKWGDATWPKKKGDQKGQKPGCTFCYESRDESIGFWKKFVLHPNDIKYGVCRFKLPIGADCTRFGYGHTTGRNNFCMTNNCVQGEIIDDGHYKGFRYHCRA